jgi:hypothetical protein
LALSLRVIAPDSDPDACGVKVTLIVQDAFAAMVEQLLVWAKFPVTPTAETTMGFAPVLVTVTVCPALVVLACVLPNVKEVGEIVVVVT